MSRIVRTFRRVTGEYAIGYLGQVPTAFVRRRDVEGRPYWKPTESRDVLRIIVGEWLASLAPPRTVDAPPKGERRPYQELLQ